MYKTSKSISELHLREARKLIKRKKTKKASMSTAETEELQAEINTATINALFAYGT